ncbi:MAG: cytochrome P460 family protein [Guyparkeria sp.]|uniref:cytochrome P460 family protein n=1 Tax=Guyparkeria sp. TaxID=2035736 RepID=UPI00397CFAE7
MALVRQAKSRSLSPTLAVGMAVALVSGGMAVADEVTVSDDSRMETDPPFGGPMNVEYAQRLWDRLAGNQLVGPDAVRSYPYEGDHPHGQALEYLEAVITVDGHSGVAMVKNNYGGEGDDFEALKEGVLNDRMGTLSSVTVMFQREEGYDSDHDDWYWAKFQPDGQLEKNPDGVSLAGRVAKGASEGCIACHAAAPGDDYVFTHDRLAE